MHRTDEAKHLEKREPADVCFGPKADIRRLFDHRIGALLEMDRHVKAKRLSGFQIDHQLEFDRSLYGKLTWLLASKNAINIRRRAPKIIGQIISVGQQAADFSEGTVWINGGETIAGHQRCDFRPMFVHESIRHYN